jgi:hypothetical protein
MDKRERVGPGQEPTPKENANTNRHSHNNQPQQLQAASSPQLRRPCQAEAIEQCHQRLAINNDYSSECCEACSASNNDTELFGYRQPDGWRWFCADHRLGKWFADKRLPALTNNNNGGGNEQID